MNIALFKNVKAMTEVWSKILYNDIINIFFILDSFIIESLMYLIKKRLINDELLCHFEGWSNNIRTWQYFKCNL